MLCTVFWAVPLDLLGELDGGPDTVSQEDPGPIRARQTDTYTTLPALHYAKLP
jgi:hypothetical protein